MNNSHNLDGHLQSESEPNLVGTSRGSASTSPQTSASWSTPPPLPPLLATPMPEVPDFWSKLAVAVFLILYLVGLASSYIAFHFVFYLLGGGGIRIDILFWRLPVPELGSFMGTGLLEGTSLGHAYMEHKKLIPDKWKWLSWGGHLWILAAQALVYYAALGNFFFTKADFSSLSTQSLENSSPPPVLNLKPPTFVHGALVITFSVGGSALSTFVLPQSLLAAINSLRRRKKDESDGDLEFLANHLFSQMEQVLREKEMARKMDSSAQMLKQIQTWLDSEMLSTSVSDEMRQTIDEVVENTPDLVWKQGGWTKKQVKAFLVKKFATSQHHTDVPLTDPYQSTPPNWFKNQ